MKNDFKKTFVSNLSFAFMAQLLSLALSVITSLIAPKLLGIEQFAYWQLFIFYSGYVGFFHLGLLDGIYLKCDGTELDVIDKPLLGFQLRLTALFHAIISLLGVLILFSFPPEKERKFVWILTVFYMMITNAFWFLGLIYQAANRTKNYSIAIIINKVFFTVCVLLLMAMKLSKFKIYVVLYVVSQGLALLYCAYKGGEFISFHQLPLRKTLTEMFYNAKIGINFTFSNLAGSFILSVGWVMIDATQGISSFGMVSLATSLASFLLQSILRVSMVMFPMLRQSKHEKMKHIFVVIRGGISYLLCTTLALYVPLRYTSCLWLPQYAVSLKYLVILLPICIFGGKMQLLYNTYLKVPRKGKALLLINPISLGVSVILHAIGAHVLNNMTAVVTCMVITIVVRSLTINIYLSKLMSIPTEVNAIWECVLSLIFILSNMVFPMATAFCVYLIALFFHCTFTRKNLKECTDTLKTIK